MPTIKALLDKSENELISTRNGIMNFANKNQTEPDCSFPSSLKVGELQKLMVFYAVDTNAK